MSAPPPSCLRMTAAAARKTVKCPFRWVAMTASHSSSDMLKSIRSRKIPATATTPSMRSHFSTAVAIRRSPDSILEMSSATAIASPPALVISVTTASATSLLGVPPAHAHAEVAHQDLGPGVRGGQCHRSPDAAAPAGDGDDLAFEEPSHG